MLAGRGTIGKKAFYENMKGHELTSADEQGLRIVADI